MLMGYRSAKPHRFLGVPTGTVKAQSAQGRQKLKELMRRTQAAISETAKSIIGVRKFDKLKLVRRKPRPVSSTAQVDEAQETSRRLTPHNLHSRTVLRSSSCGYWPSKPVHRFRVRQCLLRSD